jgi:hypothetical protein
MERGKPMDILVSLKDFWINFIFWLKPNIPFFIIRMGLLLSITYALLSLALIYSPVRTVFFQVCAAFIGVIIALNIPLVAFRETSRGSFALIVTFFFLCMVFLPSWLPGSLVPVYRHQLNLRQALRFLVWILFLIQILIG